MFIPLILLFRKTEAGSERLENGDTAREHDLILIQYIAAGEAYGAIFSVDGLVDLPSVLAGGHDVVASMPMRRYYSYFSRPSRTCFARLDQE